MDALEKERDGADRIGADNLRENLAAYALGALEKDERLEIEALVCRDEAAAAELEEMLETLSLVSMRVGDGFPAPKLKDRLLERVEAEVNDSSVSDSTVLSNVIKHIEGALDESVSQQSPTALQRITGYLSAGRIALATSLSALVLVSVLAFQLSSDNAALNRKMRYMEREVSSATTLVSGLIDEVSQAEASLSRAEAKLSAQADEIKEMVTVNEALRSSMNDQISLTYATLRNEYQTPDWSLDSLHSSDAYVYLLEHHDQPLGALVVGGMSPAPTGKEYRLYLIGDESPIYAASFNMNEAGYSTVIFSLPSPLSSFNGAHITREAIDAPPDPGLAEPANRFVPR